MASENQATHLGLTEAVASLPSHWYFDPEHHRRELSSIWARNWIYLCHESALDGPRSFMTLAVGDQNLLVLRDNDGELRAFHNACRHRGSRLCTETAGKLKSKRLVCPYHAWGYALEDGRLLRTSSAKDPSNFNPADYGLFPVGLAVWRGFVFVNLDKDAAFSGDALARSSEPVENYPLEDMLVVHRWRKTMACNWKVFWENFNECLHCPNLHPELSSLVPLYSRRISNPQDAEGWEETIGSTDPRYRGGLREGAETWSSDGSAQNRIIPGLSEADLAAGQKYVTSYPSVFIGAYADHVRSVRILPLGPEETEITAEWLLPRETAEDPDYDRSKIIDFAILVMMQDAGASELSQMGLHAAPLTEGVLMPEEHWVKHFQDWVRAQLEA